MTSVSAVSAPGDGARTYWSRLQAAVRPEFRVDRYQSASDDPVLAVQSIGDCPVPRCSKKPGAASPYCDRHARRWTEMGEPSAEEFLAKVPPVRVVRVAGSTQCHVENCDNPGGDRGWCRLHADVWRKAGQPKDFAANAPPVATIAPCRVPNCYRPEVTALYGLCYCHRRRWNDAGRPPLEEFSRTVEAVGLVQKVFVFIRLPPGPKLELQYAVQHRRDAGASRVLPSHIAPVVETIVAHDPRCASILDRPLEQWEILLARTAGPAGKGDRAGRARSFLRWSYAELSLLVDGDPFLPDRWDVRRVKPGTTRSAFCIDWSGIPQPWLRDAAKRWARVRMTTKSAKTTHQDSKGLIDFARFLDQRTSVVGPTDITRREIESYIAYLSTDVTTEHRRSKNLATVGLFLRNAREHELLPLQPSATVRPGDYRRPARALPRFLPDSVMEVLERPESLAMLPAWSHNLVKVLMGTGRRASEACSMEFHSLVEGPDSEPYLRYFAGKELKEHMIPLDPPTAQAIRDQQVDVLRRWPGGSKWLFPRTRSNPLAVYPMPYETLSGLLRGWAHDLDLREPLPPDAPPGAQAPFIKITSHRFRHTIATRMVNEDVPVWVIQRFLGHDSSLMTQRYAAIHDKTLKEAFDKYRRRVTVEGKVIVYEPGSPMTEGMQLNERLKRARQTLSNGYCARPLQTDCIHPNFCHGCTQFATDVTFLPVLRGQRDRAAKMRDQCLQEGREKWADRNERDVAALNLIITKLETLPDADDFAP